jgi:hypothetical protein
MTLCGGMRAALVAEPDGHRFLVEERVRDYLDSSLGACDP